MNALVIKKQKTLIDKIRGPIVFIALLLSSMLGAQLFGVSLNKVALIPLLIILAVDNTDLSRLKISNKIVFILLFYVSSIIAVCFGLTASYGIKYEGYNSRLILFAVQIIVFYCPLVILLDNASNKKEYFRLFKRSVVLVARLYIIWAFIQFIIYSICKIDINLYTIGFLYNSDSFTYASPLLYIEGVGTILRSTGLIFEPAYFGLVLIIGTCFDKSNIFRLFYLFGAVIAISRSTILILIAFALLRFLYGLYIRRINLKITKRNIFKIISVLAIAIILIIVGFSVLEMTDIFKTIISKFNFNNEDIGTDRHFSYPIIALEIITKKYNILQVLFGFGPRVSGTIINNFSPEYNGIMNDDMLSSLWATECDISELLLGYGIVGFSLYYITLLKSLNIKNDKSYLLLLLVAFGVMYDISSSTYLNVLLIFVSAGLFDENKKVKGS